MVGGVDGGVAGVFKAVAGSVVVGSGGGGGGDGCQLVLVVVVVVGQWLMVMWFLQLWLMMEGWLKPEKMGIEALGVEGGLRRKEAWI